MKPSTTASILLGLLLGPAMMMVSQAAQQLEVSEGGVKFKVSRFDDGRTTPYRIYFWDKDLTGSSYRFDEDGNVVYFKAGSTVYYDRMEMDDGSVTFMSKTSETNKGLYTADGSSSADEEFVRFNCDQCTTALSAVCDSGLPTFCNNLDTSFLGRHGYSSVGIVCDSYKGACATAHTACDGVCADEQGGSSVCSNGIPGVESSNGKACCPVQCGTCGGVGCSGFGEAAGLDADDCCATEIADDGEACSDTGMAPCYIATNDSEDDSSEDDSGDDSSDDDNSSVCSNGIHGVGSSNGKACCVAQCGACGGVGCSDFGEDAGLDADDCCATEIADEGEACSVVGKAPCFIDIDGSDDDSSEDDSSEDDSSDDDSSDEHTTSDDVTTSTTTTMNFMDDDDAGCSKASLSVADLEALAIYDNDMYVEPACVDDSIIDLVVGCNYMGLGQSCRGCYMTCEGALSYIADMSEEIESRGEEVIVNFCPDSEVEDLLDDCA